MMSPEVLVFIQFMSFYSISHLSCKLQSPRILKTPMIPTPARQVTNWPHPSQNDDLPQTYAVATRLRRSTPPVLADWKRWKITILKIGENNHPDFWVCKLRKSQSYTDMDGWCSSLSGRYINITVPWIIYGIGDRCFPFSIVIFVFWRWWGGVNLKGKKQPAIWGGFFRNAPNRWPMVEDGSSSSIYHETSSGCWLNQPIFKKILVKLDDFPKVRDEHRKYLSCHQPVIDWRHTLRPESPESRNGHVVKCIQSLQHLGSKPIHLDMWNSWGSHTWRQHIWEQHPPKHFMYDYWNVDST